LEPLPVREAHLQLEGLHGELVERGDEGNDRRRALLEEARDVQPARLRHLEVEERQVRFGLFDHGESVLAVAGFAGHLHVRNRLEEVGQEPSRGPLLVRQPAGGPSRRDRSAAPPH
jgi:hypothetical protein